MKHVLIASMLFLALTTPAHASESPSSFTSPKDSRKKDRMTPKRDDSKSKLSSSDKERIKGGERRRRKEQANHLAKQVDLITRDVQESKQLDLPY